MSRLERTRVTALNAAALVVSTLVLTACFGGEAPGCGKIQVTDAWVRQAPPGAAVQAGYFTLTNNGDNTVVVHAVQSPDFARTEMHETVSAGDGQTRMQPLQKFSVRSRSTEKFTAGGRHLMLFQPRLNYEVGDKVLLRFVCGEQRAQSPFNAEVRSSAPVSKEAAAG